MHLLAHDRKLKEETEAKKGETKLKSGHKKPGRAKAQLEWSVAGTRTATVRCHERSLMLFLLRKPASSCGPKSYLPLFA